MLSFKWVVVAAFVAGLTPALAAADRSESLTVAGVERPYILHVPEAIARSRPVSLVLVLHGGGGRGRGMIRLTGFNQVADREKFVVAYPDGVGRHWNDRRELSSADDVGFMRALIDRIASSYAIDPKRVYATGISNGGFFSQRLACELSDRIAAVASVAATMPEPLAPQCKPARPVSVMFVHGTGDPLVPIAGGAVARNHGRCLSLAAAAEFWRAHNQASNQPRRESLPDSDAKDGTRVERAVYSGGRNGTEVVVYTIQGGGHTWPGGLQYLPALLVGRTSRDLNATETIWEFFKSHPQR